MPDLPELPQPLSEREIEELIVRIARENRWEAGKIQCELQKLGYRVSEPTMLKILRTCFKIPVG